MLFGKSLEKYYTRKYLDELEKDLEGCSEYDRDELLKLMGEDIREKEKMIDKDRMCSDLAYFIDTVKPNMLDCCEKAAVPCKPSSYDRLRNKIQAHKAAQAQKKENTMRNDINVNLDVAGTSQRNDARDHLIQRIDSIFYAKYSDLSEKFHLNPPKGPKTVGEFKERIEKGLFTLDFGDAKDEAKLSRYNDISHYFSWRTPDTQKDQEGFNAAEKKLEEAKTKATDDIYVLDAEKGLEALREFEAWTL